MCIDATLEPGHLTYGEYRIAGPLEDEVLISCHSCHPSLCNDNLSGMTVAALARRLTGCHSAIPIGSSGSRARSARSRGWP